jgi:hypothetical protein
MALATGTLTFTLGDLLGAIGESIDPTRVKVWIESNLPDGAVVDTSGNMIRVGNPTADVSVAGSGSFVGLPLTTFVTGMQYRVFVEYPDAGTARRETWSSGWFDFTATGDLTDQDMQATAAPVTWQTAFTDAMETIADEARAYRDQAQDISGIDTPDSLVAALVSATSGSATTAVLAALYADKAATTSALAGKIATALIGAANGVTPLDSAGKVSAAYLPASVMEFQGVWNASTNTPTLADGTGNNGDVYRVTVAGTHNLGSGSQTFAVGDWVVYNGTVWQLSHGGGDTVQSVAGLTGAITSTGLKTALGAGSASGLATLGSDGKVPSAQLPTTASGTVLLGRATHNPATNTSTTAPVVASRAAIDSTNLSVTFTAPASGTVRVVLQGVSNVSSGSYNWFLRDGTTDIAGTDRMVSGGFANYLRSQVEIVVTGLTAGSSHTYRWSHYASNSAVFWRGGSDFNSNFGAAVMEVWGE